MAVPAWSLPCDVATVQSRELHGLLSKWVRRCRNAQTAAHALPSGRVPEWGDACVRGSRPRPSPGHR
eukprot:scaffold34446_cov73-Phaeocystis_antarctica.AAC.4